jgi:Amt family ammonium transporter
LYINAGDTAWMLVATALVFFMVPGLALFYGGLVGEKNVIATMGQSLVAIGIVSILWIVVGYSLAFGPDHSGIVGGFQYFMLRGIGSKPSSFAPHVPPLLFMAFQIMFAVITPALIAGFLGTGGLHAVDFAGGSVVHELAGASALASVVYLGRRRKVDRPHNVPLVLLGAGILWFGWFGFNAGSAGGANAVAVAALVNTQIGACAGMLAWR